MPRGWRLALVVAVVAYRELSLGSGDWVPVTVLFVLKPDYGTTMKRGIARAAGTMAGVTIAWAIVTLVPLNDAAIVVLLAVLAFAAYALFPATYALFSVVLTVLVALLADFSGGSPVGALGNRIVDTAVGTAIALAAITLWPPREAPRTLDGLAAYVTAGGRWLDAILAAYGGGDQQAMRPARLAARQARAQAWDAVRRALVEPRRRRPDGRPRPVAWLLTTTRAFNSRESPGAGGWGVAVQDLGPFGFRVVVVPSGLRIRVQPWRWMTAWWW